MAKLKHLKQLSLNPVFWGRYKPEGFPGKGKSVSFRPPQAWGWLTSDALETLDSTYNGWCSVAVHSQRRRVLGAAIAELDAFRGLWRKL